MDNANAIKWIDADRLFMPTHTDMLGNVTGVRADLTTRVRGELYGAVLRQGASHTRVDTYRIYPDGWARKVPGSELALAL